MEPWHETMIANALEHLDRYARVNMTSADHYGPGQYVEEARELLRDAMAETHTFSAIEGSDKCAKCGESFRHPIHARSTQLSIGKEDAA